MEYRIQFTYEYGILTSIRTNEITFSTNNENLASLSLTLSAEESEMPFLKKCITVISY